ncbi:Fc receptor-like protein 5 isoform X2 [Mixophyes fleayi]|uniref:Fc receptor-like protein 5 isoform X2 n=1 Tax=Mixophyes fleayi TaxID=3061075 RepID=UPI003F4DE964
MYTETFIFFLLLVIQKAGVVILQAPPRVYEGDDLIIRCHYRPGHTLRRTIFYKDNGVIRDWGPDPILHVGTVAAETAGSYKCTILLYYEHTDEVSISIQELFTNPIIKLTPFPVTQGDNMTLTCDTSLSPLRQMTELQFAFYRDGRNVQEFSSSDKYGVLSAQLEDSGNYTCEVKTSNNSVQKKSRESHVQVQVRPRVTFTPDWNKIFTGESMTLTCDVGSTVQGDLTYYWYRDTHKIYEGINPSIKIPSAHISHSGNYWCETRTSGRSDSVRLDVSDGLGILQAPPRVYEGDDLIIRCHHRPGYSSGHTIFYKDNGVIRDWGPDPVLHIGNVVVRTAGKYKCNKEVSGSSWQGQFEDAVSIDVQELFSLPQIKVTPHPVIAGDNMTLTCDTSLSPLRRMTELQFAFYRDGRNVQGFSSSDKYGVLSAKLEHSGDYYCDVKTSNNIVNKTSKLLNIEMEELFTNPVIKVTPFLATEGDHMTLTCDTSLSPLRQRTDLQFAFYRDGRNVQGFNLSNKYGVLSAQLEDSGNYTCEVKAVANNLKKTSNESLVHIQELFSLPEIKVISHSVKAGYNMTMTCETNLSLLIHRKELQFAFYRDGRNVQGFNLSDKYGVLSAQLEDSGKYTCEVRTTTDSVKKMSRVSNVQIQGTSNIYLTYLLPVALAVVLLITAILIFLYRRHRRRSRITNQEPVTAAANEHTAELDVTYTVLDLSNVPQSPPAKADENNVVYSAVKPMKERSESTSQETSNASNSIYANIASR